LRITFVLIGVAALILGYLGLARFRPTAAEFGHHPWDLFYYDIQLFVLGADPLQQAGPYPLSLELARFAAPAVTAYTLAEAFRLLFAAELRRLRARNSRGHIVVCGDAPLADALARQLRAAGRPTVQVRVRPLDPAADGPARQLLVIGDARDPGMLRAAGLRRATALYACDSDSAANIAVGLAAGRARVQSTHPLPVYAHIHDPELCLTLQARYLGLPQPAGVRLDFFNVDDLAARKLFREEPLAASDGRPAQLLVIGATTFGRAVVLEAARHWRRRFDPGRAAPLPLSLIGEGAAEALTQLTHRYPFLRKVCRLSAHDADLLQLLAAGELRTAPGRAVICYDNEEHALKTAMTAERFWRGGPQSVVVRLDQLAAFREGLDAGSRDRLFDEASGTLRVYGVTNAASDPELINEDLVDRLARVIHDRYCAARRQRGDTADGSRSMVPWDGLPSALRRSNREQAEDIGRKLRAIGCVLVPRVDEEAGEDPALGEAEVERLAVMEHERWCVQQAASGWRYGEQLDEARKLHPGLRHWPELPDGMRQRNHDAVREVPMILADAGFQIVRG
jgi:hypothetical protein